MGDVSVRFYGVRGSYPVPRENVIKYGGNTACLCISQDDKMVIFDAGTGLIDIGSSLKNDPPAHGRIDLFLTHLHLDHVQGLPFFQPVFDPRYDIHIFFPDYPDISVEDSIYSLFNNPLSPIGNSGIKAKFHFHKLQLERPGVVGLSDNLQVHHIWEGSHPFSGVLLYKVCANGQRVVFATDVESPKGFNGEVLEFIKNCDVLIHDSQYFESDYHDERFPKQGFGHSTCAMAVGNAIAAGAGRLYLFHYDPDYSDGDVENMWKHACETFPNTHLAREMDDFILRS